MNERGRPIRQPLMLSGPLVPFAVTREAPCPYLPSRTERKVVAELPRDASPAFHGSLSRAGFRRSHLYLYRPACTGCSACVPVRVRVDDFQDSASLRRIWSRNAHLAAARRGCRADQETYTLFRRYIDTRHGDGEMATMTYAHYRAMLEDAPVDAALITFREPAPQGPDGEAPAPGQMVAACLTDELDDGLSAVYSFFEPRRAGDSLGAFMILWLIREARRLGLPYVYLGYWIAEARKMAYKTRFQPLEGLGPKGWEPLAPGT